MTTKTGKKKVKPTGLKRKPYHRFDEATKFRILNEIEKGIVGFREASRKYNISRASLAVWQEKRKLAGLHLGNSFNAEMTESQQNKLLQKRIAELTKALEHAHLKAIALETMIEVAESDLHIKIRKKRGTKQS
jgi:hypothetical protein